MSHSNEAFDTSGISISTPTTERLKQLKAGVVGRLLRPFLGSPAPSPPYQIIHIDPHSHLRTRTVLFDDFPKQILQAFCPDHNGYTERLGGDGAIVYGSADTVNHYRHFFSWMLACRDAGRLVRFPDPEQAYHENALLVALWDVLTVARTLVDAEVEAHIAGRLAELLELQCPTIDESRLAFSRADLNDYRHAVAESVALAINEGRARDGLEDLAELR